MWKGWRTLLRPCHTALRREGLKSLRGWRLHAGSEREANSFSRSSSSLMHHPSAYLLVRRFKYFSNFYIDLDARHIQGETDESDPSIYQVYALIARSKSTFTVSTKKESLVFVAVSHNCIQQDGPTYYGGKKTRNNLSFSDFVAAFAC